MKGLTATALLFVSATIASAAQISLKSAHPSDSSGNPVSVALGESFFLTAKLRVEGVLKGRYSIRFELPYETRTSPKVGYSGEATVVWGPFIARTEGPVPVTATVEADSDLAGFPISFDLYPVLPARGIESFAPQRLAGHVGAQTKLTAGNVIGIQWYLPLPASGDFQEVVSTVFQGQRVMSAPYGQPMVSTPRRLAVTVAFDTLARSSRVNPDILRAVEFAAYEDLTPDLRRWLAPETLVQHQNADVRAFVRSCLSTDGETLRPYDAVERLFLGVVAHMKYMPSAARPDAVVAARTAKGDCGFFSALFVASCRSIGVPARTVSGMTLGTGRWHVWAEFFIPGHGWIPADPTSCDELSPDGALPLFFGTVPDLNERVAVTYGFDHVVGRARMPMLQSPWVVTSGFTRVAGVQPFCDLRLAGNTP